MGWTFEIRKAHSVETAQYVAVQENAYLVSIGTLLAVVGKLPVPKHSKLGRITVTPSGVKLEAVDHALTITPGHAKPSSAKDPRTAPYELQPRNEERSEVIFLRDGDIIHSSQVSTGSIICTWSESEIQVNSSAADASTKDVDMDAVAETPEEETEDEEQDLDNTVIAVEATQSNKSQPHATPQLSAQRSIVVQETPTIARTNGIADQSASAPITPEVTEPEVEPYSTARTRHSEDDLQDEKDSVSALVDVSADAVDDTSDELPPPQSPKKHPKVVVSKKRPSPAMDEEEIGSMPSRIRKRAKKVIPSENDTDTQDSRLSTIAVDTSPAVPSAKAKRTSAIKEAEQEQTPSRSQRSSQRSTTAPSAEPYDGDTPRVATSNSSITDKSHAVKFLKKQGGALVESVKEAFNVLCVRDGDLRKAPKILLALAAGTPIVTDKWLTDSAKAGHFLSVEAYQLSAPGKEKEWGFTLKDVLGRPQTPFEGYTVHFTTSLHAAYQTFTEIEQVCKAAGAAKVTKKKMDKSEQVIILAVEDGDKEAEKLMQDGAVCYSRDLLPTSILRGALDLDSDEFKIAAAVPAEAKKTRRRKS